MDLTDDQIEDLKSLVRVGMDMHDIENWDNGEYKGDAGKFTKGAMSGVDLWVKQLRASQKASTSDSALPMADVVQQRELLIAYEKAMHSAGDSQIEIMVDSYLSNL